MLLFPLGFFKGTCYYKLLHFHELAIAWLVLSLLFLAKPTVFFQINVFCGSRAEVVLRPIFVTWLCRACTRTKGLISLPSNFHALVLFTLCFVAPEQKLFYGNCCYLTLCVRTRGLISLNFYALVLFTMYFVAPEQKLFYGQLLLPDSVEQVLEPGA